MRPQKHVLPSVSEEHGRGFNGAAVSCHSLTLPKRLDSAPQFFFAAWRRAWSSRASTALSAAPQALSNKRLNHSGHATFEETSRFGIMGGRGESMMANST